MLQVNDEFPLENWVQELVIVMKHVEGIKKREAMDRFGENITEFIGYYEIGMTPKQALDKFWREV